MKSTKVRILITGSGGLLGWHARSAVLAFNQALKFKQQAEAYELMVASRSDFESAQTLMDKVKGCDVILHLAGINRADPEEVEAGNQAIAQHLVDALESAACAPHLVYANSTHAESDSPYGRGKAAADDCFSRWAEKSGARYSNVVLPHIFGENSVPFYNTVTATLCQQVVDGDEPQINASGKVELLHAGEAVDKMLGLVERAEVGRVRLTGRHISIPDLYETIKNYKAAYDANRYPDFSDDFDVTLFNTYRSFEFPNTFPRALTLNEDDRGVLFEAAKGGGGGQTFLSWTKPGVTRGNHFHRMKVERFLVVSGQADIHVRRVFDDIVHTFSVAGARPEVVDMPTLHTHSIVNTGTEPLLTLFWAHEIFDPEHPDTYALPVLENEESIVS